MKNLQKIHYEKSNLRKLTKDIQRKICLAFQSIYFQLKGVLYKSYRQVLTPVDNLLRHLKQPMFDQIKLVAFHS